MDAIKNFVSDFVRDESGTETLEWGLVAGLIILGSITVMALIGPKITGYWNAINTALPAAPAGG